MALLSTSKLSKTYQQADRTVVALKEIDMECHAEELLVLSGRSGSGKSTLLYILAGLLTPTSGQYQCADLEPYSLSKTKRNTFRASQIGILYPDFRLLPYLNVRENISSPALELGWDKATISKRCDTLLDQFGLTDRADHRPSALSSGEQQRAALARALFAQPTIIIADEPTGNLDEENSRSIIDTLKDYAKAGNSVIIATHDPIAIEQADRQLTLDKGTFIAS